MVTSSKVTTAAGAGNPAAAMRAVASARVADVTMATRSAGSAFSRCDGARQDGDVVHVGQLEFGDPSQALRDPISGNE